MTNNLPAKKPIDVLKSLISTESVQNQFRNAMGKHADLFTASLIDVFNSGLQDCVPATVVQEALKAAVLKLPISKSLGFAYLVPYNRKFKSGDKWQQVKEAQFQIGYKGMIQLAMRSGQLTTLNADVVYEGEYNGYDRLSGMIDLSGKKKSDKVTGYFAYMKMINGFEKVEYWSKEDVLRHASEKSQAYQTDLKYKTEKSAWFTDLDSMGKKTVLKSMLSKYAPMSIDFITAMQSDEDRQDDFQSTNPEVIDAEFEDEPKPEKKTKKSEKKAEKQPEPKEEVQEPDQEPVGEEEPEY